MKQKNRMSTAEDVLVEEPESTDFTIINGDVYPEDEIPLKRKNDLPETFDEDRLYEEYRDREFFEGSASERESKDYQELERLFKLEQPAAEQTGSARRC